MAEGGPSDHNRRPRRFDKGEVKRKYEEMKRAHEAYVTAGIFRIQSGPRLDPYAASLFRESLKDGYEEDKSIRVNVVGNFGQGKTSLVQRLIGENPQDTFSTNGINVDRYKCQQTTDGKISYTEKTTRTQTSSQYIKRIVATTSGSGRSIEKEKSKHSESSFYQHRVWRNPSDISKEDIELLNETAKKLREQKSSPDFKSNEAVDFDIWDFGGQHIFYATHTLFHSTKAVYILVFNVSLPLYEVVPDDPEEGCLITETHTMEYFLRFWVNSVHSFVGSEDGSTPSIILVGTHTDKLKGGEEEKRRQSENKFDEVRSFFHGKQSYNHIRQRDFAVNNKDMQTDSFTDIRRTILQLCDGTAPERIPTKWINLEMSLGKIRGKDIVTLGEIAKVNRAMAYPLDHEQIKLFLKYHHDKGTLFHFDENPIADYVVLNPQYLIDAFKCIITPHRFQRNAENIQMYWKRLREEAKLEMLLINEVWTHAKGKNFMKYKDVLLLFLNKHLIISEALEYNEETGTCTPLGWYIVPSLLRDHISAVETSKFLHEKNQTKIRYILKFENSAIVPTIYHRLIAACLGKWSTASYQNKTLRYKNLSVLRLDKINAGLIEMTDDMIELSVVTPTKMHEIDGEIADSFRRFVETVVLFEFRKHRSMTLQQHTPYDVWYKCTHSSHELQRSVVSKPISDLDNENEVLCPDSMSHVIKAERAKLEWFQGKRVLNIPDVEVPLKLLSKIATCIGNNWELLASDLRLTSVEIDHIKSDNHQHTVMQIYAMLQKWKKQQQEAATMQTLIALLQKHSAVNVNWDEIRNIVGETNAVT